MPKTISAGLEAHLAQESTTLCTIWRITRTDGQEFFFTDHDRDLEFPPSSGMIYESAVGYNRTAVANAVGLSVDNLDVQGFFQSGAITEDELRAGLFDYAEVRVSEVNWSNLSQGAMKLRRGRFGEVTYADSGLFQTELRGLTQAFSQTVGELFQSECRADVGDTKCKIAIHPTLLTRNLTVPVATEKDQRFRVPTLGRVPLDIVNGGFEDGNLTGWTTNSGAPAVVASSNGLVPKWGGFFLTASTGASWEIEQIIDMTADLNLTTVDAGGYLFDVWTFRANSDNVTLDSGRVLVKFLDSMDMPISNAYDSGAQTITPQDTWVSRGANSVAVPALTRKIKVTLIATYNAGAICEAAFDEVRGVFRLVAEATGWEVYQDRMYVCTTAGITDPDMTPAFDITPGAETQDGNAVFTTEQAWKRAATVGSVTNRRQFTITVTETRAIDDWFNYGAVTWETGDNTGLSMEVKDYVDAGNVVHLFLTMPYDIQVGDKLTIYPGCSKMIYGEDGTTLEVNGCVSKFDNIFNYRGEPYVPGQDEYLNTPDAR